VGVFETIANGAVSMVSVIASIICCLIAFVAIFNFIDAVVAWFFEQLNVQDAGFSVSSLGPVK
jgi:nucleoside permease NupC